MNAFARHVLEVAESMAPPGSTASSHFAKLQSEDVSERITAARALAREGQRPEAYLLRSMLRDQPRQAAKVFREAIATIDPEIAGVRENKQPIDETTLKWLLSLGPVYIRIKTLLFLRNHGRLAHLPLIDTLLADPHPFVSLAALEAAAGIDPARRRAALFVRLMDAAKEKDVLLLVAVAETVERFGYQKAIVIIKPLASHPDEAVRMAALKAWASLHPPSARIIASEFLTDYNPRLRELAARLAAKHGSVELVDKLMPMAQDTVREVVRAAQAAVKHLSPERLPEFALNMAGHENWPIGEAGIKLLCELEPPFDPITFAIERLLHADARSGSRLLDMVRADAPERFEAALQRAIRARDPKLRARATKRIALRHKSEDDKQLKNLLQDREAEVRYWAARGLLRRKPRSKSKRHAIRLSTDPDAKVRRVATWVLKTFDDPLLVEHLVPRTRDPDMRVREAAIRALARYDDPRVFSELVSSLDDVSVRVRRTADAILAGEHGDVPVLLRYAREFECDAPWKILRARVESVNQWASRVGQELTGCPVRVSQYRQGIGLTPVRKKNQPIDIAISDYPVTTGHPFGQQIMKGIALHEIGHHVADMHEHGASATRGIAKSEGIDHIYEILIDERLERVLRSRRPEWGVYFDRLGSYAFAQNENRITLSEYAKLVERSPEQVLQAVGAGDLPGRLVENAGTEGVPVVAFRDIEWLGIEGLVPPLMGFLACLRCGFDPKVHPNPNVAKAVKMVPGDLKALPHSEVLQLSRRIATLIGRRDDHEHHIKKLRQRVQRNPRASAGLKHILERLAASDQLPNWTLTDAPGIRQNKEPPQAAASARHGKRRARLNSTGGQMLNRGMEQDFDELKSEFRLSFDAKKHKVLVSKIRRHIRVLRAYMSRLGFHSIEEPASRTGWRLDLGQARMAAVRPSVNLLIKRTDVQEPDLYLGVLIDRSSSMEGVKIERARSFGVLVAESARSLQGIEGHISGFDDSTFYELGGFDSNAIACLSAGGGNNDAGALWHAAKLALKSGRRNKLLIMISDGLPTACSVESLKLLVMKLTRTFGIVCVQVAVGPIDHPAFRHCVDLSHGSLDEAVARFGRLLMKLTHSWR